MALPCFGQVTTSESMRTAPMLSFGITPSIDFRLYVERVAAQRGHQAVRAHAIDAAAFAQLDVGVGKDERHETRGCEGGTTRIEPGPPQA